MTYMIYVSQELQLMRDEQSRGPAEVAEHARVEQVAGHVRVHRRQRVVQQVHVRATIHRPRQWYSRSLTYYVIFNRNSIDIYFIAT